MITFPAVDVHFGQLQGRGESADAARWRHCWIHYVSCSGSNIMIIIVKWRSGAVSKQLVIGVHCWMLP